MRRPRKIPEQSELSEQSGGWIYACAASGLLLGLSVPSFAFLPLGFLAWAWCAPLLFELKRTERFLPFLLRALVAVGVGFSIITLWVVNASILGFLASAAMGTFVWTTPFVLFYFVRRFLNWNWALLWLPFIWTAWEWLYHSTEFSFGAVRLAHTQAGMLWLIQYADITGVEGVTFWVVLLNVSIFLFSEKLSEPQASAACDVSQNLADDKSKILSSIRHYHRRASRSPMLVVLCGSLFALPLAYAAYVFFKPSPQPETEITILAVQPNVSPFVEYAPKQMTEIFGKQLGLTDKALKNESPDLVLWHEVAVPYVLSENETANNYLGRQIKKWNAPVLTGLIEVKDYADGEPRPPLLEAQNRRKEYFNAATLFQPERIVGDGLPLDLSKMYFKRRLMPFVERVPFVDTYPAVADWIIPIGDRPRFSFGEAAETFDFQTKNGSAARVGTMICYDNLYPELSADLVRGGARFLTAITNEGFFAGSQGQYQLAMFSRFRSIETRRAMVRAAATGMTWATDKFGRVTAQAPMRSEQILFARVALSDEQTIYVQWGNFFPKTCALLVLLLVLTAIWRMIRRSEFFTKIASKPKLAGLLYFPKSEKLQSSDSPFAKTAK